MHIVHNELNFVVKAIKILLLKKKNKKVICDQTSERRKRC